jgi:GTP:adenosylcobinamide-phosphate guanylyltransferase
MINAPHHASTPHDKRVVAIVLGGGNRQDALALHAGVEAKGLVPFQGKPLGLHVLEALHRCFLVRSSIYVGPVTTAMSSLVQQVVPSGTSYADSLRVGLEAASRLVTGSQRLLIVTADLPWLTPSALEAFITASPAADIVYPVVRKEDALEQFPEQRRTFVRLREGAFTGGNLLLLTRPAVPKLLPFVDRAYRARKNPLALAALVGPFTLVRFLLGRLSLQGLEARVSQLIGVRAQVFVAEDASVGADVDKPAHLSQPVLSTKKAV